VFSTYGTRAEKTDRPVLCCTKNMPEKGEKTFSTKKKLRGFSPQVNYTDRAIAAGQRR
jgi:hypothetical protein